MKKILYILSLSLLVISCGKSKTREAELIDSENSVVDVRAVPNTLTKGDTIWVAYISFNNYPYVYTTDSGSLYMKAILR